MSDAAVFLFTMRIDKICSNITCCVIGTDRYKRVVRNGQIPRCIKNDYFGLFGNYPAKMH